ncbi:hypothetical protein BUTYVIB_00734 [Eshraghiella crossota DSM 2876]|uniref:Uncharacterized protein n=1 Tax=Eshraghiella crossota DSM 2876 TaxID=511680 RepID=D4RY30_9FIRM|nr:hypothetical protein BUTYVIB_00734 [Butyrivibrio crossotus DSM 2876]
MGRGTRCGSACCESLPKSGKSSEKVEKSEAAGWKSLPKQRETAERVEKSAVAARKSLPKQRKSPEKVENPRPASFDLKKFREIGSR